MKTIKKNSKYILVIVLFLMPYFIHAQNTGGGDLAAKISGWNSSLRLIAKSVISLAAIGGGMYAYFKMQSDEGGNGKKALGSFVGALIFAALMFSIIDFFGV